MGKTYPIPQVRVLIDRHVSLIESTDAIHPHIVPVNGRVRARLRHHGPEWLKVRADDVPARALQLFC
jgi:hypothetical protein